MLHRTRKYVKKYSHSVVVKMVTWMWPIFRYTLSAQFLLFTSLLLRFYAARYNLDHYNKENLTQSEWSYYRATNIYLEEVGLNPKE